MNGSLKLTGRGAALGGGAAFMLLVGFVFSDGPLMTLGACGLMLLTGCFFLARRNLQELELKVELPPRFFAARSVPAHIELFNRRTLLSAWGVEIQLRFPYKVECSGHAAWTPARGSSVLRERVSIPARVSSSTVEGEFRSSFPLGMFEVRRKTSSDCPALVYPKLITPPELQWNGAQPDLLPLVGTGLGELVGEPRGIREYQAGDRAARIHQSASARAMSRGQGLQVRAFDPPGFHAQGCRLVFHSLAKEGEMIRWDRFERGLSLAAGTLAHFHTNRMKVTFQADFADWRCRPCENRTQYFDCLALLADTERAKRTQAGALSEILQQTPEEEQLIIISDAPADEWADQIPPSRRRAIVINIHEVHFKKRHLQLQTLGQA